MVSTIRADCSIHSAELTVTTSFLRRAKPEGLCLARWSKRPAVLVIRCALPGIGDQDVGPFVPQIGNMWDQLAGSHAVVDRICWQAG